MSVTVADVTDSLLMRTGVTTKTVIMSVPLTSTEVEASKLHSINSSIQQYHKVRSCMAVCNFIEAHAYFITSK